MMATIERLSAACDAAERRESELGIQVVAQAARLRLAEQTIEAARSFAGWHGEDDPADDEIAEWRDALDAWDAVPGDVGVRDGVAHSSATCRTVTGLVKHAVCDFCLHTSWSQQKKIAEVLKPSVDDAAYVLRCQTKRAIPSDPPRTQQCDGARGHRSACFGGVRPPPVVAARWVGSDGEVES